MKIALAQLNPTIGDFEGNLFKIEETLKKTKRQAPDLVVFSELFLVGYPPRDLLEKKDFLQQSMNALSRLLDLSKKYKEPVILCGTVLSTEKKTGKGLYNSAVLIQNGKILFKQHKSLLPTYDVFDEARYFDPAPQIDIFQFKQEWLGITICEDAWNDPKLFPENRYTLDPVKQMAEMGATLFINISASPFTIGKEKIRHQLFRNHARTRRTPFLILNQVGGNDELIFDGRSMAFNQEGEIITILPPFTESLTVIDLDSPTDKEPYAPQEQIASVYHALVLGIRDYMDKCGFKKTVIGLSGGIDSALVSCLASDAKGPENVLGVSMPSPFSSPASIKDAQQLAKNLGIQFKIIPITQVYRAYLKSLETHFSSTEEDVTEENIQARIRGNILMAMSNKFGYLTLSPGNKSELSVGYCTLYGDMSGGLGVLSDVPKTMVYQLSRYRNRENEVIPATIFKKPPSAELKPGQKDEDTLPPYEILDRILHLYLDRGYSKNEIIAENIDKTTVDWVIRAVDKNEFKRRQAAPGLKVTTKAFGTGRRMPIAAKYSQ
jgi:NAD+ synthase (glutamine-hydrolysing)